MRKPTPVAPSGLPAAAAATTTPSPAPADGTASDGSAASLEEKPAYDGPTVPVRVLRNEGEYTADQVAELPENEVAAAVAAGWADDHEDAVAYARSLEA